MKSDAFSALQISVPAKTHLPSFNAVGVATTVHQLRFVALAGCFYEMIRNRLLRQNVVVIESQIAVGVDVRFVHCSATVVEADVAHVERHVWRRCRPKFALRTHEVDVDAFMNCTSVKDEADICNNKSIFVTVV